MRRETRIQKTSLISPTSNTSATLRDVSVSAASDEPSQMPRWSRLTKVSVVELLQLVGTPYKIPCRVPNRVRVVALPTHIVLKGSAYNLAGEDLFDFSFVVAANLDWQWWFIYLAQQQVIRCLLELV
jgi:hypothetical protein